MQISYNEIRFLQTQIGIRVPNRIFERPIKNYLPIVNAHISLLLTYVTVAVLVLH